MEKQDFTQLTNGMAVLGEPMDGVESASFQFLIPAGSAMLPDGCCGAGEVITDWVMRGAGERDNRALVDALDGLGIHRNTAISAENMSFSASIEAETLAAALELFADILLEPQLDKQQFELSKQLAIGELAGLDDDPRHKVMLMLAEQYYPEPYNRCPDGTMEDLQSLTADRCSDIIRTRFNWPNAIFSVAGKYNFASICETLQRRFGTQKQTQVCRPPIGGRAGLYRHIPNDGAQVHIGLMTSVPPMTDARYYDMMAVVSILSGGMSGRLFTEVREKRGLCYAVSARYASQKELAGISCYVGTTPEKAQETLDVAIDQFRRLRDGISQDELQRAKIGLKSSLIMQSESSLSRCGGIAGDYFFLNRVRTIHEIRSRIEQISVESVADFLNANPFDEFTCVSIGPCQVNPH